MDRTPPHGGMERAFKKLSGAAHSAISLWSKCYRWGALIMDAIEIVSTNRNPVNAFCIVSSDSDYYSLALRLREHGMYVAGIGRQGGTKIS